MSDRNSLPNQLDQAQAVALLDGVHAEPTLVRMMQASRQIAALRDALGRVSIRIGCLSSFTFDSIKPSLELQALRAGLALDTTVGPYGQFEQELINPSSALAASKPDVLLLAIRLQDVCPALYDSFCGLSRDAAATLLDGWFDRLTTALRTFSQHSSAYILMQNYDLPASAALGIADRAAEFSQRSAIADANERLAALAGALPNVQVMDYDALVARHGRARWSDSRTALFARIPIASEHYWPLAGFYVRHLRPLFGLTKKVLVLDADHTLWGGVVGDVGPGGIALGQDFPGNAFVLFQKRILDLYNRGVVLALASKNEPGSVEEVLEKHPEMVLRAEHFAAMRVNWEPKPDNLRQMAADLNLGLDGFVFIDDSPVECELMRTSLPQVMTVQLPSDPAAYPGLIESLDCFDQQNVSAEDRKRGALYKAEAGRRSFQEEVVDLPIFYRRLEMRMTLFVNHAAHVARASQMTNRTNQFNMHTIRCTEDDIRRFISSDDHEVVTLALEDRFGDNGVVGLAVLQKGADAWTAQMFLMSCRVLGRTVEQTFVRWIAERAQAAGAKRLVGQFVPTAKNKPFAGFFEGCGFRATDPTGDTQRWTLDLADADTEIPDWMTVDVGG